MKSDFYCPECQERLDSKGLGFYCPSCEQNWVDGESLASSMAEKMKRDVERFSCFDNERMPPFFPQIRMPPMTEIPAIPQFPTGGVDSSYYSNLTEEEKNKIQEDLKKNQERVKRELEEADEARKKAVKLRLVWMAVGLFSLWVLGMISYLGVDYLSSQLAKPIACVCRCEK